MSTDLTWAAPATEGIDHGMELSDTEHAREALFAGGPALFGGGADRRALGAALRRLPPAERRVVRMRLFGHESADAIASALDLPRPRVVLLLARGLSRVRHDLLT
ncbi:hypothetical protein GCM10007079_28950 [Nocardiopsis terrae]|uniref:DNA-directed RNA polymerase specialized sigma24 family protein n=1 Tax=Nocardiopsis terrae TaxID=372655 RepID=A0ABR9HEQ0_9ACTN|nr:sigma factor-like helix-turn-helix DNA-binding protein [Nocardiopsis terrae]MBE1457503.1 DNA-directed RNA polymerase specialized sigma24 family protein [Nocardiopsis terrae]GHC85776.1 hypothetical protein GCM10007079_28950 [Nocardiopsis terrae]